MMEWQEAIIRLFNEYQSVSVVISIVLNIIIAILGLVPSVFLTGANILFFGFWTGTSISFLGEVAGAIVSFWLYRKGVNKFDRSLLYRYRGLKKLINAEGKNLFYFILSLRLLPFVPSGLVTLAAAMSKATIALFAVTTVIGKLPALLLEAFSVHQILQFTWIGKLLLIIVSLYLAYLVVKNL
ncbi:TVP38/TMEM64 family protein [Fictibacillus sp. NRS-1165]|uniref:TVP38/TMEM64 family protein n=1 Tax=Fictibacillus sp. NRS-1165 TaxID=3144463 RepID=UPI003D1B7AC3